MENSTCKYSKCGATFQKRRANQRYCSRACRLMANNELALANYRKRAFIEKPQRNNFTILESLGLQAGEEITKHKEWLNGKGYNHGIISHYQNSQDKSYPAIYNYILIYGDDSLVKIIKYG